MSRESGGDAMIVEPLGRAHLGALSRFAHRPEGLEMLFNAADPSRAYVERTLWAVEAARARGRRFVFAMIVPRAGIVGVCRLDRHHERQWVGELGFGVGVEFRGRGYASAAAAVVLDHAFAGAGLEIVEAGCAATNAASLRVLEKLGFVPRGRARSGAAEEMRFAIHRDVALRATMNKALIPVSPT